MIELKIAEALKDCVKALYNLDIEADTNLVSRTNREFTGDFTIVVFPFVKAAKKSPEVVATEIGNYLMTKLAHFTTTSGINGSLTAFNAVKGFLNLSIASDFWLYFLQQHQNNEQFGFAQSQENEPVIVEYSSPNTNKPLHLGHIRNNLLGSSIARILKACGKNPIKVNLVNDRGIHICKSMLAWQKFGNGETPENSGMKGDHLAGKYYVEFDKQYKQQISQLTATGKNEEEATKTAPLLLEAQEMLRRWEAGDNEIRALWQKMNSWVYQGFEETYQRLGVDFDKTYYESDTYILGKAIVEKGLQDGVFFRKEDGSVWVDLTDEGLDEKLLLRADGTSVYMTQDLGTAQLRYEEFHPQKMVYVVGNEQDYHFNVLKLILAKKLHKTFGEHIFHLSYGMVELPEGKMKSREGTVVDADDLMNSMFEEAKRSTEALGKSDYIGEEAVQLYEMIGMGALKYFILKVDPKKNMLFNPNESIDFNGNTAPFIQYTYARIASLLRKATENRLDWQAQIPQSLTPEAQECKLLHSIYEFPQMVKLAGDTLSPALIANYVYELAKEFNRFYQEIPIFKEQNSEKQAFRLQLSQLLAITIKNGMNLLGIGVPERM